MEKHTARSVALSVLNAMEDGKLSHLALKSPALSSLSKQDKEFAIRCICGVIERKITLDYFLSLYTKRLKKNLRNILRLGLYQIQYMNSPDFAVVSESVELAKRTCPYASSLVNAVLRKFLREKDKITIPNGRDDIKYSCPPWLLKRLEEECGKEEAHSFLEDSLKPAPIYLRTNILKTTDEQLIELLKAEGVEAKVHPDVPNCIKVISGNPIDTAPFKEGLFHVQDVSSQVFINEIASYKPKNVLDICAAPGGKSFTLYQQLDEIEEFLSCDLHEKRLNLLKEGANRLRFNKIKFQKQDAKDAKWDSKYDIVLCDLPCSGFGVIRRKPEIKYKTQEEIAPLKSLQREILQNAATAVFKKGGRLIYSTCTLLSEENTQQVAWFLKRNPSFSLETERTLLPSDFGGDGFYFAILQSDGGKKE